MKRRAVEALVFFTKIDLKINLVLLNYRITFTSSNKRHASKRS